MTDNGAATNLAELIEPHQYELKNIKYEKSIIKHMGPYDLSHLHECKDMLELILRIADNNSTLQEFTRYNYFPDGRIEKYTSFVRSIVKDIYIREDDVVYGDTNSIKLVPATGRLADFCEYVPYMGNTFAVKSTSSGYFHLAMDINFETVSIGRINRWQAHYITIHKVITSLGEKAKVNGTLEQLREIFKFNTFIKSMKKVSLFRSMPDDSDYDMVCESSDVESAKTTKQLNVEVKSINETLVEGSVADENTATNMKTTEQTNDTTKVENIAPLRVEKPVEYHGRFLDSKETYEKLFSCSDSGLFEHEPVTKANILFVKDFDMVVKLNGDNTVTLRTNVKHNGPQPQKDIVSDVIDCVRSIPLKGNQYKFASVGFRFNGTLYQIEELEYRNMYSYIIQKGNDLSMIPKDLIKSAIDIEKEVANLPEIDFCKEATVSIDDKITIRHGENTIRTYIANHPTLYQRAHHQYIKSRPIVGKFDGKLHLFLKIGARRYKIMEISDAYAAELFVNDPDMYVA